MFMVGFLRVNFFMEDKMKTLRKLNKDEITLLKLLTDAYLFANLSDCEDCKWNENYENKPCYIFIEY